MDRRTYLQTIFKGQSAESQDTLLAEPLDTYAGQWTKLQAAHLLRRTTFATNRDLIQEVTDNGLSFTLDQLFASKTFPQPPINYYFDEDPNIPIGSTWVDKRFAEGGDGYRKRSIGGWTINLLIDEGIHIREKMTLFWHNHLVTESINDARLRYQYIDLLRRMSIGNFKTLIEEITINTTMLYYLNGRDNKIGSPNENYSRELLELFVIGKGALAGAGDYTNYTEVDVEELAKALTGWRAFGRRSEEIDTPYSEYVGNRHDTSTKTLSHRFGNATISDNGKDEYLDVINTIFQQDEVAKFICRKLYRYFLQETISPSTEIQVIEPLADILRSNNYEIEPVLRTLFASEHFYDPNCIGTMIKNPLEQIVSAINTTKTVIPQDDRTKYEFGYYFHQRGKTMQMEYFNPPNVAGWKAYYQEPSYYRLWISSVTLPERVDFIDDLVIRSVKKNDYRLAIDPLGYVDQVPTDISKDPNLLIADLASTFFCNPLDTAQVDGLKEILIPGLPDFEWTVEYGNYLDPATTSDELKKAIENKLQDLFRAMLTMPEFFLC